MLFEIIAVLSVALAAAGVVLGAARLLRLKPHRSVGPLVAAGAMILFVAWSRYTWAERSIQGLPEGTTVIARTHHSSPFEPWTLAVPRISQLVVLDAGGMLTHPDHPGIHLVTTFLLGLHEDTLTLRQAVDCIGGRRAVTDGPDLPPAEAWVSGREPETLFRAVCEGPDPSDKAGTP
jgi:hypothetical protein